MGAGGTHSVDPISVFIRQQHLTVCPLKDSFPKYTFLSSNLCVLLGWFGVSCCKDVNLLFKTAVVLVSELTSHHLTLGVQK